MVSTEDVNDQRMLLGISLFCLLDSLIKSSHFSILSANPDLTNQKPKAEFQQNQSEARDKESEEKYFEFGEEAEVVPAQNDLLQAGLQGSDEGRLVSGHRGGAIPRDITSHGHHSIRRWKQEERRQAKLPRRLWRLSVRERRKEQKKRGFW
jgi:hypothetical protein